MPKCICNNTLIIEASPSSDSSPEMSLRPLLPLSWAFAFCKAIFTVASEDIASNSPSVATRDLEFLGSILAPETSNLSAFCSATSFCGNAANCARIGVDSAIFDHTGCTPFVVASSLNPSKISSQDSSQSSEYRVFLISKTASLYATGEPSSINTSSALGSHSIGPADEREPLLERGLLLVLAIGEDTPSSSSGI